jgi:hypothetical protein
MERINRRLMLKLLTLRFRPGGRTAEGAIPQPLPRTLGQVAIFVEKPTEFIGIVKLKSRLGCCPGG